MVQCLHNLLLDSKDSTYHFFIKYLLFFNIFTCQTINRCIVISTILGYCSQWPTWWNEDKTKEESRIKKKTKRNSVLILYYFLYFFKFYFDIHTISMQLSIDNERNITVAEDVGRMSTWRAAAWLKMSTVRGAFWLVERTSQWERALDPRIVCPTLITRAIPPLRDTRPLQVSALRSVLWLLGILHL